MSYDKHMLVLGIPYTSAYENNCFLS
jgi:hypothetical protein